MYDLPANLELILVCCTESSTSALLHPSHHFNTTHATVHATNGARVTQDVVNGIYWADQSTPLGLVIVMGHAGTFLFPVLSKRSGRRRGTRLMYYGL